MELSHLLLPYLGEAQNLSLWLNLMILQKLLPAWHHYDKADLFNLRFTLENHWPILILMKTTIQRKILGFLIRICSEKLENIEAEKWIKKAEGIVRVERQLKYSNC